MLSALLFRRLGKIDKKDMIGSELLRFNKQRRYLAFDTETTGLNLGFALPWQVSFSLFTLDSVIEEHNIFIWWDNLPISKDAARITRFDFQKYKREAMPAAEALKFFEKYLYDPTVYSIAHNQLNYDSMIHHVWRRRLGLEEDYSYLQRSYDTIAVAKAWKKGFPVDRDNFLAWQYRMMGYVERGLKTNLAQLGRDLNIAFDEGQLHDALTDIRLLREVWKKLIWQVEI